LGLEEHGEVDGVGVVGDGPGEDALGAEGLGGSVSGRGDGGCGFLLVGGRADRESSVDVY